jgi:hypothetical protein
MSDVCAKCHLPFANRELRYYRGDRNGDAIAYHQQCQPVTITISKDQYDALMAAARALANLVPRFEIGARILGSAEWATTEATKMHRDAIAALRAAGIKTNEG